MKIKKILPLASLAAVAATVVPAAVACSKAGTFEVVEKEVLGTTTVFGDNTKSLAVYGITLSQELKEGEELEVADATVDSTVMEVDGNAQVQLYPGDNKYAYVQVPLKNKTAETSFEDGDAATIGFTLSSTKGSIETKTFSDLKYVIHTNNIVDIGLVTPVASKTASFEGTAAATSKDVTVSGLKLVKNIAGDVTTFDGNVYFADTIEASDDADATIKVDAWTKMTAIEAPTNAGEKTHLTFPATMSKQMTPEGSFTFTKTYDKKTAIKVLFVPNNAKYAPYYSQMTMDPNTAGYPNIISITVTEQSK